MNGVMHLGHKNGRPDTHHSLLGRGHLTALLDSKCLALDRALDANVKTSFKGKTAHQRGPSAWAFCLGGRKPRTVALANAGGQRRCPESFPERTMGRASSPKALRRTMQKGPGSARWPNTECGAMPSAIGALHPVGDAKITPPSNKIFRTAVLERGDPARRDCPLPSPRSRPGSLIFRLF